MDHWFLAYHLLAEAPVTRSFPGTFALMIDVDVFALVETGQLIRSKY